jgi:pimeloyl-ACP methyl ester carboxylesterase
MAKLEKLLETLPIQLERPVASSVMWGVHQLLKLRGFRFEVRRNGAMKIGLWRKVFREKTLRNPKPKRIVFLPGFGDTPLSWISIFTLIEPVLKKNFDEIILVDLPGYNGSLAKDPFFQTIDVMMDSLFDVLDSLRPHTIMGHSLGGFFAAHYAAACSSSERVSGRKHSHGELDSLIVVDPSGIFESDLDREEWRAKIEKLYDKDLEAWRPFIFAKEPMWFKYVAGQFLDFGARREIRAFIESHRDEHEVQRVLPKITTKVSLIWGEDDSLIPASFAKSWLKFLTSAKGTPNASIIKGVGHSPQIEAPAVFSAIIGQILSGRTPHALGRRWYRLIE